MLETLKVKPMVGWVEQKNGRETRYGTVAKLKVAG